MFGLSFFELLAIFVVALLVFGPERLPEIARVLGKLSGELKKTSDSVRREFYNSVYPPAEELQATYRKLTTSPLAQLKGTCEETTKSPDTDQAPEESQLTDSRSNPNDSGKASPLNGDSTIISTTNVTPDQIETANSVTKKTSDSSEIKSEHLKGE
jgi:Tat protein translocase TatB subunit